MTKEQKDTLTVRVTSMGFSILTFAIFKPLGMGGLDWMVYPHLAAFWVLGIGVCYLVEAILTYIVRMPASLDKGVEYIIRRNLWFQLINTPLMALTLCSYFHFAMSAQDLPSPLTGPGYLTCLLIVAFCSFAIGLYWRFKFRSQYLAAELEETKRLNEAIKYTNTQTLTQSNNQTVKQSNNQAITLSGSTSESITLSITDLLYIESVGNYVKVYHLCNGDVRSDMLRATSKQMEEALMDYPTVVRCHRAFLVNLAQVEKIASQSGTIQLVMQHTHDNLPVSRTNTAKVKSAFNSL